MRCGPRRLEETLTFTGGRGSPRLPMTEPRPELGNALNQSRPCDKEGLGGTRLYYPIQKENLIGGSYDATNAIYTGGGMG